MRRASRGAGRGNFGGYQGSAVLLIAWMVIGVATAPAHAVQPVFEAVRAQFFDFPFPYELRRDADGTVSLAGFPFPAASLAQSYATSLEETTGFGVNSGVFVKFDGEIDTASLPASADASRAAGASVFLINIDPQARHRGERIPLWIDFRPVGDRYRGPNLLSVMPVPGHPLEENALYALVITDSLQAKGGAPLDVPLFMQHMRAAQAGNDFEQASLPLYAPLWDQLETHEALSREHVIAATVYRTGTPTREMLAMEEVVRTQYGDQEPAAVSFNRRGDNYWLFTGQLVAPQFQEGTPPFPKSPSGRVVFDEHGQPLVQREDHLEFVLTVPQETEDGRIVMPANGWPVVQYQHGTGGDRFSFVGEGIASTLAAVGIASISTDAPLHGIRPGSEKDGEDFYNPYNPYALRDNTRQAASEGVAVHELIPHIAIAPVLITAQPSAGFRAPSAPMVFDPARRMFMGHSQGAANGPMFLAGARNIRGGVLSAASSHLILNILTRSEELLPGVRLRGLVELLLGSPVDVFHPALHMLQMGSEVSENVAFGPLLNRERADGPLSILFTNGLLDGYVPTPLTVALAAGARYPLIAPLYPVPSFPPLPGYSYAETFALAGLAVEQPPVSGNIPGPPLATGGLVLFPHDGHFAIFDNPQAHLQYQEFLRALAYDDHAVVAAEGPVQCGGDCDGNGVVTIDELVTGVNITRADRTVDVCPQFDRDGNLALTMGELLSAVASALSGCGS